MTPPENDLRDAVARLSCESEIEASAMVRALSMIDALPTALCPPEETSLRASLPGGWPTIGDLRAFVADLAKARADLERVTAERDVAREDADRQGSLYADAMDARMEDAIREEALRAENARLRTLLVDAGEALRPLADAASHHEHTHDDACVIAIPGRPGRDQPRVGQLRRARSTLAALDKAPTPKEPA